MIKNNSDKNSAKSSGNNNNNNRSQHDSTKKYLDISNLHKQIEIYHSNIPNDLK